MKAASKAVLGLFFAVVVLLGILQAASADFPQQDTPLFPLQQVSGSVLEDASVGVSAADAAAINQGSEILTYVIAQYPQNLPFKIGRNTGVVTVSGDLDYETKQLYQFYVQATDSSEPSNSNTTLVSVSILDVNDNPPVFAKANYSVFISKSLSPLSSVITVVASDRDALDSGELTYGFLGGSNVGFVFALDVGTGLITLAKSLTSTLSTVYNLRVGVSDRVENLGTADVTITVIGGTTTGSGEQPVFGNSQYNLNVPEDQVREIEITRFQAILVSGASGEITYRLLPHVDASLFQLTQGGVLMVSEPLDYEKNTSHVLTIEAKGPGDLVGTAQVNINVQDVNDNAPEFTKRQYDVEVSESSNIGQIIAIVTATDGDRAESWNGQLIFTLRDHQDKFRMVTDGRFGVISLAQHIDAETARDNEQNSLEVLIQVRDPDFFDFTTVSVTVFDVNDNNPIFDPSNATISVNDSVPTNTVLYTVSARDIDAAAREIRYRLKDTVSNLFSVDALTGNVSLTSALSFESAREHSVTIIATDNGSPPRSSQFLLKIMVTKATQVPPIFSPSSYSVSIAENSELDRPVALLLATDPDGSIASYQIDSASVPGAFRVTSTGLLLTSIALDRESTPIYTMLVSTVDNTGMASSNSADITITITDRNDMRPEFSPSDFSASIMENAQEGSPVLTLNATDADAGINAVTEFGFVDPLTSLQFSLDSSSGDVTLAAPLPRNSSPTLVFYVFARDGGTPQRQSIAKATVTIVDVNDAPRFHSSSYAVLVSESTPAGSSLLQLNATDGDRPPLNGFILTIRTQSTAGLCNISNDGTLTLNSRLDFETGVQHTVTVRASDSTVLSLFSEAAVTINVANANDNTPLFAQAQYTVRLLENATTRSPVVRLQAADNDAVPTIISYSLASTADAGSFSVSSDGVISTEAPLDYEIQKVFVLELLAQDDGQPRLTGQTTVIVQLEDVNDNYPTFQMQNIVKSIPSSLPHGSFIAFIYAMDLDSSNNSMIEFVIPSEFSGLPVKITGNEILLSEDVSSLPASTFKFDLIARDYGSPRLQSLTSLPVEIKVVPATVGDTDGIFVHPSDEVQVVETVTPEEGVYTPIIRNNQSNEVFTLLQAGSSEMMDIDRGTGRLSLAQGSSFDYNLQSEHFVIIGAERGLLRDYSVVRFHVVDVNTHAPVFLQHNYASYGHVAARASSGLLRVTAIDQDRQTGHVVSYSIKNDPSGLFQITADGIIQLRQSFLSGSTNFTFNVSASDNGQPPRVSAQEATVVIVPLSVSSDRPLFLQKYLHFTLKENTVNSAIVTLNAATGLISPRSIVYSIVSPDVENKFEVGASSGVLRNTVGLDREAKNRYDLVIQANRVGFETDLDFAFITIEVEDANDNHPIFVGGNLTISIDEKTTYNTALGEIRAKDADSGINAVLRFTLSEPSPITINQDNQIILSSRQYYNSKNEIHVIIYATDNGLIPLTSQEPLVVIIRVVPINEFRPEFENKTFAGALLENSSQGTFIMTVKAVDRDVVSNITYSIPDLAASLFFDVDQTTGAITSKVAMDHESIKDYIFMIAASDSLVNPKIGYAIVEVSIKDKNDNSPKLLVTEYRSNVLHDSLEGYFVEQLKAEDRDSGMNGQLVFTITDGNVGGAFLVDSNGVVRVKSSSGVSLSSYTLTIALSDAGTPPRDANASITVRIAATGKLGVSFPIFDSHRYTVLVSEALPPGSPLLTVAATNSNIDGPVTYAIPDEFIREKLLIDSSSGVITSVVSLDREKETMLLFCVLAENSQGRSGVVNIELTISDANDNVPHLMETFIAVAISENAMLNTSVARLTATDPDIGDNGRVQYEIMRGNVGNAFQINEVGTISVASAIDFEVLSTYTLFVQAFDVSRNVSGIAYEQAQVAITVSNVNDQAPVFSSSVYTKVLTEGNSVIPSILRVNATDPDRLSNVVYRIVDMAAMTTFSLDPNTGVLSSVIPLDHEVTPRHRFCVEATTTYASVSLNSIAMIEIEVVDRNDKPTIGTLQPSIGITTRAAVNSSLLKLDASDQDTGNNGRVIYIIIPGEISKVFFIQNDLLLLKRKLTSLDVAGFTVSIQVFDGGSPPLTATRLITVAVSVTDVTNNRPTFTSNNYTATIPESNAMNEFVLRVSANDLDSSDQIRYFINDSSAEEKFSINPANGDVHVRNGTDFETKRHWEFCVTAEDNGIPPRRAVARVDIHITDVNDNPPYWLQNRYSIDIGHNTPVGASLVHLLAADKETRYNLTFVAFTDNLQGYFGATSEGDISVIFPVVGIAGQQVNITVVVLDNGIPSLQSDSSASVIITVVNMTERSPLLSKYTFTGSVTESSTSTSSIVQITPAVMTGRLSYDIIGSFARSMFTISSTGVVSSLDGFDYEDRSSYSFCVAVTDQTSTHPNPSTALVKITVADVNDNHPNASFYSFSSVSENTAVGSIFGVVHVEDLDSGQGGIRFVMHSNSEAFSIDQKGVVRIQRSLNQTEYSLNITVSDQGAPPLLSSITKTVKILPGNNVAPRFQSSVYSRTINESPFPMASLIKVAATDPDNLGPVEYHLEEVRNQSIFAINTTTGVISTKSAITFSMAEVYSFCVVAVDSVSQQRRGVAAVEVTVIDINSPPQTEASFYSLILEESYPPGVILRIPASDSDAGVEGELLYTIASGDAGQNFDVDDDGNLMLLKVLDLETKRSYELKIKISDKGSPPLFTLVTVNVTVANVRNNILSFQKELYEISINETMSITAVLTVSASAQGIQVPVTYTIKSQYAATTFEINPSSGVISSRIALDFETAKHYRFCVEAFDAGSPPRQASTQVVINLIDVNDNRPKLIKANYTVQVSEAQPIGFKIVRLMAEDADSGVNGMVRFNITHGNDDGHFQVDEQGVVKIERLLDSETRTVHLLIVSVQDKGQPSLTARENIFVQINVVNINDNNPRFSNDSYRVTIVESTNPVASILQVSTFDIDSCGSVAYSIVAQPNGNLFSVNSIGILRSNSALIYSTQARYELTVQATDGCSKQRSSKVFVTIQLLKLNQVDPVWQQLTYTKNISNLVTENRFILRLLATDSDAGMNGRLTYTVVEGDGDIFGVDEKGSVFLKGQLSSRNQATFTLFVSVNDNGVPRRTALNNAVVTLHVRMASDPLPQFTRSFYNVAVNETAVVTTILTTGADGGGASFIFSILNEGVKSMFTISPDTGVITNRLSLDYETQKLHTFCIAATSNVGSHRRSVAFVTITVLDVNDNAPVFEPSVYSANVLDDTPAGSLVLYLFVSDKDAQSNGEVALTIFGESNMFEITNGNVLVTKALIDYDSGPSQYNLTIVAQDRGNPSRQGSNTASVRVNVVNLNDHSPEFHVTSESVTIKENITIGSIVATIQVTDSDLNDEVTLSILEISARDIFAINSSSGVVTTKVELDFETTKDYTLTVAATDSISPVRSSSMALHVHLENVNDNSPLFTTAMNTIVLEKTLPVGSNVFTAVAMDADADAVSYNVASITPSLTAIEINLNTGVLTLVRSLNETAVEVYVVEIEATDAGGLVGGTTLNIRVIEQETTVDLPITSTNVSTTQFTIDLRLGNYFSDWQERNEFWIILQQYHPNDPSFDDSTKLPPVTWHAVHILHEDNNNKLKRYKAYKYVIPTNSRRRREVTNYDATAGVITFIAGNEIGCGIIVDPNGFCNGPLLPGQFYRVQVIGLSPNGPMQTSGFSSVVGQGPTSTVPLRANTNLFREEIYWTIGLCVLGSLTCILTIAIAVVIYHKKRASSARSAYAGSIAYGTGDIRRPSLDHELYYTTRAARYQNPVYTHPEARFAFDSDNATGPPASNGVPRAGEGFYETQEAQLVFEELFDGFDHEKASGRDDDFRMSRTLSGRYLAYDAVKD